MPKAVQEWVKAFGEWLYDRSGGWTFDQPTPQILYKYYRPERVHVLHDCSVRFSQRTVFEDGRELRPEVAAFGTEEEIRAYLAFNPWGLSLPTWLKEAVLRKILTAPGWQERILRIAQSGFTASDEFAVFCLCEQSNSDEMWEAYAGTTGFVLAFDTTHDAFESLRNPGKLGRITYSDEPLGTFIGSYGPEAFFRKCARYAFECEWRIIRAIHQRKFQRLCNTPGGAREVTRVRGVQKTPEAARMALAMGRKSRNRLYAARPPAGSHGDSKWQVWRLEHTVMKAKTTTTLHRRCNSRDIVQPLLTIFIG